jgi:drug/metabolite transporter (DMT)-like permease
MSPTLKAQLQLHFCVLLWGATGIFGRLISLDAYTLVWWRLAIVVALLLAWPPVRRGLRALNGRLAAAYAGIGVLLALHWLTFYAAIKLSNASVGATCLALGPAFIALLEPGIGGRRVELRELALGIAVVPGVVLVAGGVSLSMRAGLAIGMISSLLSVIYSVLNKRLVDRAEPAVVTAVELGAGLLFLSLGLPLLPHGGLPPALPGPRDGWLLAALAGGCTLLPYILYLQTLRRLRAFTVQLAINLEPVYTILIAVLLLDEQRQLDTQFYAGVAIILATVFVYPWLGRRPAKALPVADAVLLPETQNAAK